MVRRSKTPLSNTRASTLNSGRVSCWRPRVKVMNTGHNLPGGAVIGLSAGRAARLALLLLGDIDQEGITHDLGIEHFAGMLAAMAGSANGAARVSGGAMNF